MHNSRFALALCPIIIALAACGEVVPADGTNTDAAPGEQADAMVTLGACEGDTIALDDIVECFVAAQCNWLVTCGYFPPTVQNCIAQVQSEGVLDLQRTIEAVEAGKTIFDGMAAANCLAGIDTSTCGMSPGEDCSDVFVGTVADGQLCFESNECSGVDADCRRTECTDQCCAGSCLNTAGLGEDCSSRDCAQGDHCVSIDGTSPYSQCYTGAVGVSCSSDYHCDDGLYCNGSGGGGTCLAALAEGVTCAREGECVDPLSCVSQLAGGPRTCRKVDMVNAPCDNNCEGDLFCEILTQGSQGSCKPKRAVNGICSSNSHCQPQLYCRDSDSTCQPPATLNMACESYNCAPGLFCTSELDGGAGGAGVCAAPMINGNNCNSDSHCESGVCTNNACEGYMSCYL